MQREAEITRRGAGPSVGGDERFPFGEVGQRKRPEQLALAPQRGPHGGVGRHTGARPEGHTETVAVEAARVRVVAHDRGEVGTCLAVQAVRRGDVPSQFPRVPLEVDHLAVPRLFLPHLLGRRETPTATAAAANITSVAAAAHAAAAAAAIGLVFRISLPFSARTSPASPARDLLPTLRGEGPAERRDLGGLGATRRVPLDG